MLSNTHPSVIFLSLTGMNTASSEVLPTELSFLKRNLTSFCRLSSGTTGRPSMTINVSRPSSTFTSYCALRSRRRIREGHTQTQRNLALTGEINLLLLFLVEVLLGQC